MKLPLLIFLYILSSYDWNDFPPFLNWAIFHHIVVKISHLSFMLTEYFDHISILSAHFSMNADRSSRLKLNTSEVDMPSYIQVPCVQSRA